MNCVCVCVFVLSLYNFYGQHTIVDPLNKKKKITEIKPAVENISFFCITNGVPSQKQQPANNKYNNNKPTVLNLDNSEQGVSQHKPKNIKMYHIII